MIFQFINSTREGPITHIDKYSNKPSSHKDVARELVWGACPSNVDEIVLRIVYRNITIYLLVSKSACIKLAAATPISELLSVSSLF